MRRRVLTNDLCGTSRVHRPLPGRLRGFQHVSVMCACGILFVHKPYPHGL